MTFNAKSRKRKVTVMKINFKKTKSFIEQNSLWCFRLLRFSYIISLLAILCSLFGVLNILYFFDLFSHFNLQYMIGGAVLFIVFLFFKKWKIAFICLSICILCLIESRWYLQYPLQFFPEVEASQQDYQIMMLNHYLGKTNFDDLQNWLSNNEKIDAVILQEANLNTVKMAKEIEDVFPYQIHEPRQHYFGIVVLSRYPFLDKEKIVINGPSFETFAVKFSYKKKDLEKPVYVYSLHPPPPSGPMRAMQRDFELTEISKIVKQDSHDNVVMIGDWNLTPFAPAFGKVIELSGLNYQSYGLLLNTSWPSFNLATFLKIPIDHALYSDNLIQTQKTIGPSFGSDHHVLIVSYTEK